MDPTALRRLPPVNRLLEHPELATLRARLPHPRLVELIRAVLEEARAAAQAGQPVPDLPALVGAIQHRAAALLAERLRPVINATGVILHTNLGRAPLSQAALAAMQAAGAGYTNLEYDLPTGVRGSRHSHIEPLLQAATGAAAGLAVNNNAAAVFLVLTALASGREVLVSRAQAVEIGGGFRIPDVLRQSGATLVEVGTTNRTYVADYAEAITDRTAAILRVHRSNFRILGFTHEPNLAELAELARARGIWLFDDLGSGCLIDTRPFGLAGEPLVQASLAAGADLVCFSGDKLLGGPQAGLIAGRADLVNRLKRHPLARALRLDKATIAALQATLAHYVQGEALTAIPIWRMISATPAELAQRAQAWAAALGPIATVRPAESTVGGGSLPGETLPTCALVLQVPDPMALAARLRTGDPAVIARIADEAVWLDPRTVDPADDTRLLAALQTALRA